MKPLRAERGEGGKRERERKGEGRGGERIVESSRMATYTRCCRGFWGWGVDERKVLKCSLILGLIFGILLFLEESIYFDSLFLFIIKSVDPKIMNKIFGRSINGHFKWYLSTSLNDICLGNWLLWIIIMN